MPLNSKIPHRRVVDVHILAHKSQAEINEFLNRHALPVVSTAEYNLFKKQLSTLFPEHFETPLLDSGAIAPEILDALELRDMYAYLYESALFNADSYPKESYDKAFKILSDPMFRRALQAMAMAQISEEEVELYANAKSGIEYDTEVYMIYFKYFFDTFDWTYGERVEYRDQELDPDLKRLYTASLKKEKDFVVWKLGLAPQRSFKSMLEDVARDSYYNFKDKSSIDSDGAQKWAQLMLKAVDKIAAFEESDKDSMDMIGELRFHLKTVDTAKDIVAAEDLGIDKEQIQTMAERKGNELILNPTVGRQPGLSVEEIEAMMNSSTPDVEDHTEEIYDN